MIEIIIDEPQRSDMGLGRGHYELSEETTLIELLDYIEKNNKSWGTISIYDNNKTIRYFDFDLFNKKIFYHNLEQWRYKCIVKKVDFYYCFMNEDISIFIK